MAPPEKKKNPYQGAGQPRGIGEMYEKELQNSASYLMDEASNLKKMGEEMYRVKSDELNKRRFLGVGMDKLKKLIKSYVPENEQKVFYKQLGYLNSDVNAALKDLKKYGEYTERLSKLLSDYNREKDPISRSMNKNSHVMVKMEHEIENLNMERTKSIQNFEKYNNKVKEMSKELTQTMLNYSQKKKRPEEESRFGNAVLIIFSAMFGMSVLWALSQTQPGTVTVGAFVAGGETSPVLISMLTGTVIFLAFFLSHHKLK
ncbi:MAG: hypothetical protein HY833_03575 [Candidatus Aenigmarchaeota archaeon]|nr:hypothetical protein [Candidatus Aenigmarchaeota archaeon]